MEIFPTRSALHDGGIALLEKKHLYFTIVVTDQQLEYLRKKLDVSKSDFDEKISKITAETGLESNPTLLPQKTICPPRCADSWINWWMADCGTGIP